MALPQCEVNIQRCYCDQGFTAETFAQNNDETMHSAIESIRIQIMGDNSIPPSKKSREIITRLNEMNIFDLKDSAQIAAQGLNLSIHTIYRYLRELRHHEALH